MGLERELAGDVKSVEMVLWITPETLTGIKRDNSHNSILA